MSKYKELKSDYDKLIKDYHTAIADAQKYKIQLENLQKIYADQKYDYHGLQAQMSRLLGINNVNADVIQFLAAREFGDNPAIEFAAIKTYRGWETLYLHGEKLNPYGKDVTIWAENNEAVRVEVSGS